MKIKNLITIVALVLFIGLMTSLIVKPGPKIGYIINNEIYSDFKMMKELEAKLETEKNDRKLVIDSLELRINLMMEEMNRNQVDDEKSVEELRYLQQKYMMVRQKSEEEMKRLTEDYYAQVWNQINQYVMDYGKENGYAVIYGANADGNLMYADETLNITEEVKKFINEKYNGQ